MMMLHKINRRLLNGGLLAAIAVTGLVGCGGGGDNVPRRNTVPLTGGVNTNTNTLTNDAPANPNGQNVAVDGGTAFLAPTDEPTPAGTTVVIVPQGTRVFDGLTRSASRAPGDVYFIRGNGQMVDTGVNVTESGALDGNIAFGRNGTYRLFAQGPYSIARDGKRLDISEGFGFTVRKSGNELSLPTLIDGTIPSNGGTAEDMFLGVTYPMVFDGSTVRLTVEKSNGDITQTRTLINGSTTFRDIVPDVVIPSEGVQTVWVDFL
ncbi:MAG: hypothetical protein ACO1SV_19600 [Fimbriimonas sp.]